MKHFSILGGRCYVVEMPVGCDKTVAYGLTSPTPYINWMGDDGNIVEIGLPPGNWRIIGMLSEVTEEDAAEIVGPNGNGDYRNYVGAWGGFATAIQSLDSAILAEGFYLDMNPHGSKRPSINDYSSLIQYQSDARDFDESQPHVLDRSRCLLLGREDG